MLEQIRQAVLDGDIDNASKFVQHALNNGINPASILNDSMIPAMDVVGTEYESGIRYIPEMLISAEAMKAGMGHLRPRLVEAEVQPRGLVVLGTVEGDLHDIGKNLVGMMLEGAGFEVVDLGVEITAEQFVEAVKERRPDILAMSALLTTTRIYMPTVLDALGQAGLRESVKVIIGGAPVTQEFANSIGADGYAPDAASAATLAKELVPVQ